MKQRHDYEPCNCSAYPFPHRPGGGACNVEFLTDPVCSNCFHNCGVVVEDQGIGPYEFWGSKGVHHEYVAVSSCCKEEVISALTGEPLDDAWDYVPTKEDVLGI